MLTTSFVEMKQIAKLIEKLCAFEFLRRNLVSFDSERRDFICHQNTKTLKLNFLVIAFVLTVFFISSSFAQNKYYIYFKDKGITQNQTLNKYSFEYQIALENLSERSIERRKKNMGKDNFINYDDLPINKIYIDSIASNGIKIENKLTWFNAITAYLTDLQKNFVKSLSFVEKIEPVRTFRFKREDSYPSNYLVKNIQTPYQLNYGDSYTQLNLSDIPQVHSKGINGDKIIIGVLDTGFKWKAHESLFNINVIKEYDFIFKDSITADEPNDQPGQHNHGTTVLSVIGGFKDSVLIGAAFGSSFILAKTEDVRGETHVEEDNYAAALIWMESLGVDITTSSLGYNEFDDSVFSYKYSDMNGKTTIVTKAAELAFQRGVVTVTAAGNEGNTSWFRIVAPADGFNTIAVGAVNQNNILESFSSRGPTFDGRIKPELVAQGVSVFSANAFGFNSYGYASGTSLSTPIAAGIAALLLSAHPHLKNFQVRNILLETADNSSSPNNERGYGLISAAAAISFPNLKLINERFEVHKIFFNYTGIDTNSVRILYSTNGKDYDSLEMNYDGVRKFTKELPVMMNDQVINFYFAFKDTLGNNFREPLNNLTYKLRYGELNVYRNLSMPIPYDYGILSQNYPNPFNNKTTIKFKSSSVEPAEIVIIDAIGQKVKTLFSGLTKNGENIVHWDGFTDSGLASSSGVYLYILKIGGKEFGKKMILLR